jgi:hypothetical protein
MKLILTIVVFSIALQSFGQYKKGAFSCSEKQNQRFYTISFNVGTQFGWSKHLYGNNNFISPSVSFDVSKRLTVTGGIGMAYSNMKVPLFVNSELKSGQTLNIISAFGYASGNYKYNERLNLHGTVLLQQDQVKFASNNQAQMQYKDMLVGFDYKVAPGFTFSAQMGFSNRPGYSPLIMNHFYNDNWNNNYFLFTERGFK